MCNLCTPGHRSADPDSVLHAKLTEEVVRISLLAALTQY